MFDRDAAGLDWLYTFLIGFVYLFVHPKQIRSAERPAVEKLKFSDDLPKFREEILVDFGFRQVAITPGRQSVLDVIVEAANRVSEEPLVFRSSREARGKFIILAWDPQTRHLRVWWSRRKRRR